VGRIRTIKPEFPKSETIGSLSRDARLLFIQLWTEADDAGRLRGASRLLASLLYPYDEDAPALIGGWLTELHEKGCIRRYEVGGNQYIEIANWLEHQKIDRPSPSRLPSFDEGSEIPREGSRELDDGPRTVDLGPVPRTKDHKSAVPSARAAKPSEDFQKFWASYPKRDGANPKHPAEKAFAAAVKSGTAPAEIVGAADRYRSQLRSKGQEGTPYVKQAVYWLKERRWQDYPADGVSVDLESEFIRIGRMLQTHRERGGPWPWPQEPRERLNQDLVQRWLRENPPAEPQQQATPFFQGTH
jgi:hypothetical protein